MPKHTIYWLLAVLEVVVAGCGHRYPSQLLEAESVMDDHPDSAYTLVANLPASELRSRADSSLYLLLLTQSEIKTDRPVSMPTDTLRAPIRYFRSQTDEFLSFNKNSADQRRLMLSLLYYGQLQAAAERYDMAINPLLEAEAIAETLPSPFYQGLIDRQIAGIYSDILSYETALEYSKKSLDSFLKAGNEEYWNYEKINLAKCYAQLRDFGKAKSILNSLILSTDDDMTIQHAREMLVFVNLHLSDWDGTISEYHKLKTVRKNEESKLRQCVALAYEHLGLTDKADSIYRLIGHEPQKFVSLHTRYARSGRYKEAYAELKEQSANLDSLLSLVISQNVISEIDKFHEAKNQENESRHFNERRWMIAIFICLGTFLFSATIIMVYKKKLKERELALLHKDFIILNEELSKSKSSLSEERIKNVTSLINLWKKTYQKQFEQLEKIYRNKELKKDTFKESSLVKEIERKIKSFGDNKKFAKEIFMDIDQTHNNLMSEFLACHHSLSEADVYLMGYFCAGISNKIIGLIFNIEMSPLYTRKNRIRNKVLQSDFPRKEEILALLKA